VVSRVYMDEHLHSMELIVPDDQLSKAIGRRGQNVRLAAQLTGWRIDIFSESRHAEMNQQARDELARLPGADEELIELLVRHGYRGAQVLSEADPYEIASILGITEEAAEAMLMDAEDLAMTVEEERAVVPEVEEELEPSDDDDLPPEQDASGADDLLPEQDEPTEEEGA
jgi:N utilization substance protein A